ncbi:hypothetical protein [Sinorhizobium fredii]|nr:hypothetical protein [Sinorhizobium fredii]
MALVEHELYHAGQEMDAFGAQCSAGRPDVRSSPRADGQLTG